MDTLKQKLKTDKKNFKAMLKQAGHGDLYAGLEGAMFGRFVTSDILARSDAAVHVAHAFTVHGLDTEVDYFTVVDDLNLDDETGAAHAGDMELGAGLYYGYVAVDIPLLISNLTGCDAKDWAKQDSADARQVLAGLIEAIATVSPGAKLGATAPYAYSDFLLLEAGAKQPRCLANAYLKALPAKGDVMQSAVDAMGCYLADVDAMYGATAGHRAAATRKQWPENAAPRLPLDQAVKQILDAVFGA
ncbi:type I-E CRISPR-associated protein Cas7/Cse4/CasC [Methylogaea oryzae]|uniref:type I-E CRISPR-associated protein Cas7/Cse4/CasC n=1 Tax=Methylogaea oryzae TaxID=1295382 RepID=UPI0020D044A0|nr:type I-E CRISPR-associated protein Cas7/Cse4/CasC [Methylogaea oryzae]